MTNERERPHSSISATGTSLLPRLQDRDPGAWQQMTELYGPLVYHWCRHHGLPGQEVPDVFQDVFAAVARNIDGFVHSRNGGTFRGWLWTITRNKIRDYHRVRGDRVEPDGGTLALQRLADIPEHLDDGSADEVERSATANLFHRAMHRVREEFEPRTWQAFWRATVEGESTADIADDLGISANGVRQAKSRVLRRLRRELVDLD